VTKGHRRKSVASDAHDSGVGLDHFAILAILATAISDICQHDRWHRELSQFALVIASTNLVEAILVTIAAFAVALLLIFTRCLLYDLRGEGVQLVG